MDSLPFLAKTEDRNARPQSENDWEPPPRFADKPRLDMFDTMKANPMGLILLGVIVGVLIANMRPVVIQPK